MQGHAWNAFHNFEMHFKGGNRCIPSVQLTVMNLSIVVNIFFLSEAVLRDLQHLCLIMDALALDGLIKFDDHCDERLPLWSDYLRAVSYTHLTLPTRRTV